IDRGHIVLRRGGVPVGPAAMQGVRFTAVGTGRSVTIVSVTDHLERHAIGGSSGRSPDESDYVLKLDDGSFACGQADTGEPLPAVPFDLAWTSTARAQSIPGRFSFACVDAVAAKCLDWGYKPWLRPDLHQTCVRMARADYCASGASHTVDRTLVD